MVSSIMEVGRRPLARGWMFISTGQQTGREGVLSKNISEPQVFSQILQCTPQESLASTSLRKLGSTQTSLSISLEWGVFSILLRSAGANGSFATPALTELVLE